MYDKNQNPNNYNPNNTNSYPNPYQPTGGQFSGGKKRAHRIFNVELFTQLSPKAACFSILVSPYTGDLYFSLAPAIPGNPAQSIRGPVPAGTKVYDYSKQVFLKLAYHEVVTLKNFIDERLDPNKIALIQMAQTNKAYLERLIQSPGIDSNAIQTINQLMQMNTSIMSPTSTENSVPFYRKAQQTGQNKDDKAWSFSYDPNSQLFFVSVTVNKNNDDRIHITLNKKYAGFMYEVIKSYLTNYTVLRVLGETQDVWSDSKILDDFVELQLAYQFMQDSPENVKNNMVRKVSELKLQLNDKLSK